MDKQFKLAEDTISKKELINLSQWIIDTKKLTKGSVTIDFEKQFSKYIGAKYSVFVNSGSSANLLMAFAMLQSGRLKNKKVVVPSLSWITTVSPFIQLSFDVEMCDCNLTNLGLDLNHLESLFKKNEPSLLVMCDVLGHANNINEIKTLCKKYNVLLLEDACESLGSEIHNKKLGTFGLCGTFSFYYGHHISTIEGGMVVTDDFEIFNIMKALRSHGWSRDMDQRFKDGLHRNKLDYSSFRDLYTFYYPGFNLRSTDLNAFLGLSQLKKIDGISLQRQLLFKDYQKHLGDFWSQNSDNNIISSFAYGCLVQNPDEVHERLKKDNIESRPLISGDLSKHPFWTKKNRLVNSEVIHYYGIYLPINASMSKNDVHFISEKFKKIACPYKNLSNNI